MNCLHAGHFDDFDKSLMILKENLIPSVKRLRNISAAGSETLGKTPRGWIWHIYRQGQQSFLFFLGGGVNFEVVTGNSC